MPGSSSESLHPPAILADGRIVVCGDLASGGASGTDMFVARFTADGDLDSQFSFDGRTTVDFDAGAGADHCSAVVPQDDGKIVVVGFTDPGSGPIFAVARLNEDGTLDNGFGEADGVGGRTGKTTTAFGTASDQAYTAAMQSDGKIVVAGTTMTASDGIDFAVLRLTTGGERDTSFNLSGKVIVGFNLPGSTSHDDIARTAAVDASGRVVVGGYANKIGNNDDFAIVRLQSNGLADPNFDADGRATMSFDLGGVGGTNQDQAYSLVVQHDGRIVLGGVCDSSSTSAPNADMAVARVLPDGSPDPTFGIGGRVVLAYDLEMDGIDTAYAITQESNGKLLVGGLSVAGFPSVAAVVARLTRDGSPDLQFGTSGSKIFDFGVYDPSYQGIRGLGLQGTQIIARGTAVVAEGYLFDNFVVRLQNDLIFASLFE
jgi:uncharacterized delta-60 repeat protein